MEVMPIALESLYEISSIKLHLPNDLTRKESKQIVLLTLRAVIEKYGEDVPMMHPVKDMKIDNDKLDELLMRKEVIETGLVEIHKIIDIENLEDVYERYVSKLKLKKEIKVLEDDIFQTQKIVLTDTLKSMKRVLRRLAFSDKQDLILTKGKVACQISTCQEVLLTEFMFSGLFNKMKPSKVAAFLSMVLFDENMKEKQPTQIADKELQGYYEEAMVITKRIYDVYLDSKIEGIEEVSNPFLIPDV